MNNLCGSLAFSSKCEIDFIRLRNQFIRWISQYNIIGDISNEESRCDKYVIFDNEKAHIQQFLSADRRNESLSGISIIKKLVGNMYSLRPKQIQIEWDSLGAPKALLQKSRTERMHMPVSISHSEGVVAGICISPISDITNLPQIGIDIEKIPNSTPLSIVENFSAQEKVYLSILPQWQKSLIFTKLWTRKEALAKSSNLPLGDIISWNVIHSKIITKNTFELFQLHSLFLSEIGMVISIAIREIE